MPSKPTVAPLERQSFTIAEFCRANGFSVAQFYRMRKDGLTPAVIYIGRSAPDHHRECRSMARPADGACCRSLTESELSDLKDGASLPGADYPRGPSRRTRPTTKRYLFASCLTPRAAAT